MRLGSDPEVFLFDPQTNQHVSVIGLIKADKWNPLQIGDMPEGFTLQEDNVSLEFGIPPAASADQFVLHIQKVMERSKSWLKRDGRQLDFSKLSCTIFPKEEMKHPMAHIFGCEPDFNAWSGEANTKPAPPHEHMRSAGGHIHVETNKDPVHVVKMMDLFLSVPAVLMDEGVERKQLYGKAGAHRPKPYGVEYRSLSNFWIFDPKLIRWAWKQTERALNSSINVDEYANYIQIAVNENEKMMARALINECNLEVV